MDGSEDDEYQYPEAAESFNTNGAIIAVANVGSLGPENDLSTANTIVRSNVISSLTRLKNRYGRVDCFLAQEVGGYEAELSPIFNFKPTETDRQVLYGRGRGGIRGVANWCLGYAGSDSEDQRILRLINTDLRNEICTSIVRYKNIKGKSIPVAIINVYRNCHRDFCRTERETKIAIENICKTLRTNGVRNQVIVGDFNSDKMKFDNHRKIQHEKLFHKHNKNTARTFIDCVYTNFEEKVGILEVWPSVENVHGGITPRNSTKDLGHKFYALWIGVEPTIPGPTTINIMSQKKLRAVAKEVKDKEIPKISLLPDDIEWDDFCREEEIDYLGELMLKLLLKLAKKASIKIKVSQKERKEQVIFQNLEKTADYQNHTKRPWQGLYSFVTAVKEDGGEEADRSENKTPPLNKLVEHLNKKYEELHEEEPDLVNEYIDKQFPPTYGKKGDFIKNKKKFRTLIMSCSNSGAKDAYNLSLKDTKTILNANSKIRDAYHAISQRAFITGHFPKSWRKDLIYFFWKRKGERSDEKQYRPITIACSLGKLLEKQMAHYISNARENNSQNHAYTKAKNCQTAITEVQKILLNFQEDKSLGSKSYHYIPVLSADDISSAFQSVIHGAVCKAIRNNYLGDRRFRMHKLLESYLKREVRAIDRITGEKLEVKSKFEDRSIPQGSIISPSLWKLFDGLFTGFYNDLLTKLIKKSDFIEEAKNTAFSDDHLTALWLKISKTCSRKEIGAKIRTALKATRSCLVVATERFGCGCNPDKSENVVQRKYEDVTSTKDFETSSTIKWLGYKLELQDGGNLIFEVTYVQQKIIAAGRLKDIIFQYTKSLTIRIKFYKTYMAPIIEWFIPIALQQSVNADTIIHKFQRDCLKSTLDLPFTAPNEEVEEIMNEMKVAYKAKRAAKRIDKVCKTESFERIILRKRAQNGNIVTSSITTRGGTKNSTGINCGSSYIRKNFIFKMNDFLRLDDSDFTKIKLNQDTVKVKARELRKKIQTRIRERLNQQASL